MADALAVYDNGFYNIGVRPSTEDLGVGGTDPFGNPLSESQMVREQKTALLGNNFDPRLNPVVWAEQRLAVNGAFKTPGLRNVELTGPYMHNGGKSTLKQVLDFYDRGADFAVENFADLSPFIVPLGLTEGQKDNLVAFLLSLTDDRRPRQVPESAVRPSINLRFERPCPGCDRQADSRRDRPAEGSRCAFELPASRRRSRVHSSADPVPGTQPVQPLGKLTDCALTASGACRIFRTAYQFIAICGFSPYRTCGNSY